MTNFANRTIWTGDNLDIMRGINSASVDLIYLDPPFSSNSYFNTYVGSGPSRAIFKDAWTPSDLEVGWVGFLADEEPSIYQVLRTADLTHGNSMQSYLCMMAVRLMEIRRLLKDTGSVYLHCDATASHYLKLLMDSIFGPENFRNEITWRPTKSRRHTSRGYPNGSNFLLFYTLSGEFTWNRPLLPHDPANLQRLYRHKESGTGRWYRLGSLTNPKPGRPELTYEWNGHTRDWRWTKERMQEADDRGLIHYSSAGLASQKRYLDEVEGVPVDTIWEDIQPTRAYSTEWSRYLGQQPVALLERIIQASSNKGDLILDPFCGSGTSCVAAEKLARQWVAIDISPESVEVLNGRLQQSMGEGYHAQLVTIRTDIPNRTDVEPVTSYPQIKHVLFGRQEGHCNGCRAMFDFGDLYLDHIVPIIMGGTNDPEHFQLLCLSCNQVKGSGSHESLVTRLKELDFDHE